MTQTITSLLAEYGSSHQNKTNKLIHWICVPLIFWSIVALIYSIPSNWLVNVLGDHWYANWAVVSLIAVIVYYFRLSWTLAVGMCLFAFFCLSVSNWLQKEGWSLPLVAIGVFIIAWIGQFYGHHVEGKKPSFLKDLQFLLIGPAWLMSFIYKRLGIPLG